MQLPSLSAANVSGKKVIVKGDLDFDPQEKDNLRFTSMIPTLDLLKQKSAQIILIGKRGRPGGKPDPKLSLKDHQELFAKWGAQVLENLRFDPGEEANNMDFAKSLAAKGDYYVNENFSVSHRNDASIVSLPKLLPHAAGLRFIQEVDALEKVLKSPKRPVLALISGVKQDKLTYIEPFKKIADTILIAGRLPEYIHDTSPLRKDPKLVVAGLVQDREDITIHSVETFEDQIAKAGTIVISGPPGKFEDDGHRQGTKRVFEAVCRTNAFKVAGGGDTQEAIDLLDLRDKFDWLSVGGGAMLEFLTTGTLPGIEALKT